jgi:hypothetical protein
MTRTNHKPRRTGAITLEAAIVHPVMILLLLALIVLGMGVFRSEQVACQAREAARWTCVRGSDYARETGKLSPSKKDILKQAVLPLASGMDPDSLSIQVEWVEGVTGLAIDWDLAGKLPSGLVKGLLVTNKVRVTVTYRWTPRLFFVAPIEMKSTAEMPMAF